MLLFPDTAPTLLEECPKWKVLREVLDEIEEENKKADESLGPGRVLIAAQDDRTCSQIKEVRNVIMSIFLSQFM